MYYGDVQTMTEVLMQQCTRAGMSVAQTTEAVRRQSKRIARFYGLLNKYDGKGNKRNLTPKELDANWL